MTITEVSKKYGISIDTLRYYERIGLLPPVHRNQSGFRDYGGDDCNWVHFIKCMRSAGVSIESLMEYVSLFRQGAGTIAARKAILLEQRSKLAARLSELQETLSRLDAKIAGYEETMLKFEQEKLRI